VLLYAFQNWDVFAIGALVVGLFAYERERDVLAGVFLGLGAAIKLFPGVLVPPMVALRLARGDRRGALRLALAAIATVVVVNLPVLVARPSGWWWTYAFQSHREATWGSAWYYEFRVFGLPTHGTVGAEFADRVSLVVLLVGIGLLTFRAARDRVGPASIAVAGVAIFVLANKVYSPTYDLWLLPGFVVLPLSRRLWLGFCAVSVAVYVTVYGYFRGIVSRATVHAALPGLVAVRTVILVLVVVAACAAAGEPAQMARSRPSQ
jgi:uncharacterized membrane protein